MTFAFVAAVLVNPELSRTVKLTVICSDVVAAGNGGAGRNVHDADGVNIAAVPPPDLESPEIAYVHVHAVNDAPVEGVEALPSN